MMEERYDVRELLHEIEEEREENPGSDASSQEAIRQMFLKQRKERSARRESQS